MTIRSMNDGNAVVPAYAAMALAALCAALMSACSQAPVNGAAPGAPIAPAAPNPVVQSGPPPAAAPAAAPATATVAATEPAVVLPSGPAAKAAHRASRHALAAKAPTSATVVARGTDNAVIEPPRAGVSGSNDRTAAAIAPVCSSCGVVTDIREIKEEGQGTGLGAIAGGLAGLVVGNQIGGGNGKTLAKIAGAAGGAYLGNKAEKHVRAATHYEVTVKLDDGETRVMTLDHQPTMSNGAAVRISNGDLIAR